MQKGNNKNKGVKSANTRIKKKDSRVTCLIDETRRRIAADQ
jgi:hypothetical protein